MTPSQFSESVKTVISYFFDSEMSNGNKLFLKNNFPSPSGNDIHYGLSY